MDCPVPGGGGGGVKQLSTAEKGFEAAFVALLAEARETTEDVAGVVGAIIADVRARGDVALCEYTARFDRMKVAAAELAISAGEVDRAVASIPVPLMAALELAAARIERFHRAQLPRDLVLPDDTGLTLGMRWTALEAVGIYVPGG